MKQGLSIRGLAEASGLGPSSIVRMEAGENARPVTLVKICHALRLHVDRLADQPSETMVAVHRLLDDRWFELSGFTEGALGGADRPLTKEERLEFVKSGAKNPLLLLKSRLSDGKLMPTLIEVHEKSEAKSHPGEEFAFVLRGPVVITIDEVEYRLETGESVDFWGTELHSYASGSERSALILSVRVNP